MTVLNAVVESVIGLINNLTPFATMTRGALGTGNGLTCEIAPSRPETVFLDKNQYIPLDLTINGKHTNLSTLSETMNAIHENLTMRKTYQSAATWEIVDITTYTEPQVIGREEGGHWLMASSLSVKVHTKL